MKTLFTLTYRYSSKTEATHIKASFCNHGDQTSCTPNSDK